MKKKQEIISQISDLGLEKGDTVFVSSDLLRVGYFNKDQKTTLCDWVEIFDELLGAEGTIYPLQKKGLVISSAREGARWKMAKRLERD